MAQSEPRIAQKGPKKTPIWPVAGTKMVQQINARLRVDYALILVPRIAQKGPKKAQIWAVAGTKMVPKINARLCVDYALILALRVGPNMAQTSNKQQTTNNEQQTRRSRGQNPLVTWSTMLFVVCCFHLFVRPCSLLFVVCCLLFVACLGHVGPRWSQLLLSTPASAAHIVS